LNNRERQHAILHYENYDRMPVVNFGYWEETLKKWHEEGHLTKEETKDWDKVGEKLGFDYECCKFKERVHSFLFPGFDYELIKEFPDGSQHIRGWDGTISLVKPGVISIQSEIDHLLKDRESWETHYKHRLVYNDARLADLVPPKGDEENPICLFGGSLIGNIRNMFGVVGLSYLEADDENLYDEIIDTVANLCFETVKKQLEAGGKYDYVNFWEDICYNHGPLVNPSTFYRKVGPYYKKMSELFNSHGIDIISVDCDGMIDALIPTWLDNGVNTMFPIEVGTWDASIKPWREKYGKDIRGIGGMNKTVFGHDYAAIDKEIERLKPLIALGGYIPCPDHRIAPDAKWENVQYYCEKMQNL